MREDGLVARPRRRFKATTMSDHDQPVAANVLGRQFTADVPNQRWMGDTSEFLVGSGTKLFVAAILDLYSRYVVGWAVSAVNDRHLTIKALEMAIKGRCPEAGFRNTRPGSTLNGQGVGQPTPIFRRQRLTVTRPDGSARALLRLQRPCKRGGDV